MRLERCCALLALLALSPPPSVLAQAAANTTPTDGVSVLSVGPSGTYPATLYATFVVGDLTWDGCAPLYLPEGVTKGCPLIRGEPAWVELGVRWSGAGLLALYPAEGEWLEAWLEEDGGAPRSIPVTSRILGTATPARADGAVEMMGGTALRVRLDLSSVISTLPTGSYRICYGLTAFSDPPVPKRDAGRQCLSFFLFDDARLPARAERLRREAIDQLAEYRCEAAAKTVEDLLRVHPHSAAGFRLRGVIGELMRRNEAAVADYGHAIHLLETGGDRLLPRAGYDWARAARALDDWRQAMMLFLAFAPEMSMLGVPEDGAACREDGS